MLKSQDCLILLKILSNPTVAMSQRQLSKTLLISLSEVNAGLKRLIEARLLRKDKTDKLIPIISAVEELTIYSLKYFFPAKLGELTRGIPTGIAAPIFKNEIGLGNDPIPVWPYALGAVKGLALEPIHLSITEALANEPDECLYDFLVLVDVIRIGKPRERNIAIKLLKERLQNAAK